MARNTVWKASPGKQLKINCSVVLCSNLQPPLLWCKVDESNNCNTVNTTTLIQTQWTNFTNTTGILFLVFTSISIDDAGLYRCALNEASVSHSVNVTVSGKQFFLVWNTYNNNITLAIASLTGSQFVYISESVEDTTVVYQKNETTSRRRLWLFIAQHALHTGYKCAAVWIYIKAQHNAMSHLTLKHCGNQ